MERSSMDDDTSVVDESFDGNHGGRKAHDANWKPPQERYEERHRSLADMEADFVAKFLASSAFLRNGNSEVHVDGVGGFSINNDYSCHSRTSDSTDYSGDRHLDSFGSYTTPSTLTGVCTAQTDLKETSVGSMLTTTTDMAIATAKDTRSGNDPYKEKIEVLEDNEVYEENGENESYASYASYASYHVHRENEENEGDEAYESYDEKETFVDIAMDGENQENEEPASGRRCGTPPPFKGLCDSGFVEGINNVISVNIIENDGLFDGFEAHINETNCGAYDTVNFSAGAGAGDGDDDSYDATLVALEQKAKELEDLFHETHHLDEDNDCSVPRPGISNVSNNPNVIDVADNESESESGDDDDDDDDDDGLACEFVALEQSREILRKELDLQFITSHRFVDATDTSVEDNAPPSVHARSTKEARSAGKKGPIRSRYQRPRCFDDYTIVPEPASSTSAVRCDGLSINTDPAVVNGTTDQLPLMPPTTSMGREHIPMRPIMKEGSFMNRCNKTKGTDEGNEEKVEIIKQKNKKGTALSAETPTGILKETKKKRFGVSITRSDSLGVTPPSTPTTPTPTAMATNLLFHQQQSSPLIRRWIEGRTNQTLSELSGFNNHTQGYDNDGGSKPTSRRAISADDTMTKYGASVVALPEIDTGDSGCIVPPHLMLLPQSSGKRRQQRLQRRQQRQQQQRLQEELHVRGQEQQGHEQTQVCAGTQNDGTEEEGVEQRRDEEDHGTSNRSYGQERSSVHSSSSTVPDRQHPKEDKENDDEAEGYFQFRFYDSEEVREPQDDATTGNNTDSFSTNINDYYYNYHRRYKQQEQQEHRRHSCGHDRILYNNEEEQEDLNAIEVVVCGWQDDDQLADSSSSAPHRSRRGRGRKWKDRDDRSLTERSNLNV